MSASGTPTWGTVWGTVYRELIRNPFRLLILFVLVLYVVHTGQGGRDAQLILAAFFGSIAAKWFDAISDALYLLWDALTSSALARLPPWANRLLYLSTPIVFIGVSVATIDSMWFHVPFVALFVVILLARLVESYGQP